MNIIPRISVAVVVLLLWSFAAYAVDGQMVIITANPGKIMDGAKVLAEVPKGTRLWGFEVSKDKKWIELKIPNGEQRGWMQTTSIQPVELTEQQQADRKQAYAHFANFDAQKKAQDYAAARTSMEQGLAIERQIYGEHPDVAESLNYLGALVIAQGDYQAAQKSYEEALAIRRKVLGNEHTSTAQSLNNLGVLAFDLGDYPTARKLYEEALAIYRKVLGNEHVSTSGTLDNLGVLAREQGDYPAARKFFNEALAINRKVLGNQHPNTAGTLDNLGLLAHDQAQYSAARTYFDEALAIRRKALAKEHPHTAGTLNNLGILTFDQGDYRAARKYFEEALEIQRKILGNEHYDTALTLNNLGVLALGQGDFQAARKYYEEALAINRNVLGNEHINTAATLNNLGNLVSDQGDYPAARKYYDEALAIYRKALGNNHPSAAKTLHNLGVLALDQGDYPAAHKFYDEALDIYRKVLGNEHPTTAETIDNQGILAREQGDHAAATDSFDQNRRIIRRHVQRTLPGLSEAEQVQFLDNTYLHVWTRQLSFGWDQHDTSAILAKAASWLINGKAVAQEALAARALLARDETNPQLAPLVKELTAVRQQLAALAMSTPKPTEAAARQTTLTKLTSDEQRLARVLAQTTGQATNERDWYELDEVRAAIPATAVYVDLVRMELYDFKTTKHTAPHYFAWIIPARDQGELQIIDLGEAAPIEAAVEKFRVSLAATNQENGPLLTEGELGATRQLNAELQVVADLVLRPWQKHLQDSKQLILSPDSTLWLVPWAALPVSKDKSLLESHSLRYVLSGRDLAKAAATNKLGTSTPAIFANPNYELGAQVAKTVVKTILPKATFDEDATRAVASQSSLPRITPLPNTELEAMAAESVLAKLAGSEPESYLQDRALEAVAKNLKRPTHLLIATHGFFLPDQEVKQRDDKLLASSDSRTLPALTQDGKLVENPLLRCGLLFAGCNAPRTPGLDDGILTGLEIVGMDLRGTELVVLSACETGIGKVRNGEGVAGLRQAFQLAGAQSVVSTLWQVPDRDSAIIMQDFFTNLATGQTKADALRNAQLKRIAARKDKSGAAHPFFWAAWTVTGE